MVESEPEAALRVQGLSISFGSARVLRDVDLEIGPGELVALVGHNGSGKSTIVKVLAGFHRPAPGSSVTVRGRSVSFPMAPDDQLELGIAIVHQDLALVQQASVWENIGFGSYERGFAGCLSRSAERASARSLLAELDCYVHPDRLVRDLDISDQACVAIARAFRRIGQQSEGGSGAANLLILDEATNFFSHAAAVDLLLRVRRVAAATGIGVVVISHRLAELLECCDRMIVLRDGVITAVLDAQETSEREIAQFMILGQATSRASTEDPVVERAISSDARSAAVSGTHVALRLENVIVSEGEEPVTLAVEKGEILGLTGLRGGVWEQLVPIVGGDQAAVDGTVWIGDCAIPADRVKPDRMIGLGIGYVPAEQTKAVEFSLPAFEAFWAPFLHEFIRLGVLRQRRMTSSTLERMGELNVLPPDPHRQMKLFSGGNRQKLIVGRWLSPRTQVLALDEPTQGIDVAARADLIRRIRGTVDTGVTILVSSQDYRDLAAMCDRVIVFGRTVKALSRPALTPELIAESL